VGFFSFSLTSPFGAPPKIPHGKVKPQRGETNMNGQMGFWEWLYHELHIKWFCIAIKNRLKNLHQELNVLFHASNRNERLLEIIELMIALCLVGVAIPLAININIFFILLLPLGFLVSLHVTYLADMRYAKKRTEKKVNS